MNTIKAALIDMNPLPGLQAACDIKGIFAANTNLSVNIDEYTSSQVDLSGSIRQGEPDVVVVILPHDFGEIERALIRILSKEPGRIPVIAVIEDGKPEAMIELLKLGVVDFLTPPIKAVDVLPRMWRTVEHARKRHTLVGRLKETVGLKQLVGRSPAFLQVIEKIPAIAQSDVGVRISGETGTGKEMCARAIHYLGPRAGKPFMPVNCGAIPTELVENELFGHVRGAFTGATVSHGGLMCEANGGTLFLDEIDCLPLQAQVKILRLLQEKEYRQLGSTKVHQADVRIIAATNIDLEKAMREGTFRQDLFYRLNIIHLALPALRERKEDIPLLARHFLDEFSEGEKRDIKDFTPEAMDMLRQYNWSGNVRELENVIKRAIIFTKGSLIQAEDFGLPRSEQIAVHESFQSEKARVVVEFENRYIREILQACHGNITMAAQTAGKNRRAFWELIHKHNIDVSKYKPLSS